ncbi:tigger transposable element-derived protein 4-like [Saccostrea cucullata]|uniref:tigger transposable element-derived protein 4-like n=1 Tax=Saccostrea cuccullata TaxID=36930 RepID=UPI002ED5ED9C
MLVTKAEEFAKKLDVADFKASNGWLENFKSRQGITFKRVCGEEKSVDTQSDDMSVWQEKLKLLLTRYPPQDIYNADETGIFFRLLPDKTLEFKDVDCHGGKKNKERLTAMVCANMDGTDKLPFLVIGKSANPRCFKNVQSLPVKYNANKKAWMTGDIFTTWVKQLDKKMKKKKRKIALVIDNCPAHPKIPALQSIELIFLPPNTTSKTQPMDQGIIQNLKVHYRKRVLLRYIAAIDKKETPHISILDALHMLSQAWACVTVKTISNCFKHAGFANSTTAVA